MFFLLFCSQSRRIRGHYDWRHLKEKHFKTLIFIAFYKKILLLRMLTRTYYKKGDLKV